MQVRFSQCARGRSASVRFAALGLGAAMLAGCVQTLAESRVQSALVDAGLDRANADCMATRMVDRLTIDQLRKLKDLKPQKGEPARPTTLQGYVERVSRVGDAEVLAVTSSSAALCVAGLG